MSAVPTNPLLTEEEYLKIERAASEKSDFYQGEMFSMAGASRHHNAINANLVGALNGPLGETSCRLFANDMRVKNEVTGFYNYPDVVIYCGEPRFLDRHEDVLLNPRVVIEVLSKSTESYDRGFKFESYRRLATCREYILVSQTKPLVERFVKQPDGTWLMTIVEGLDEQLTIESVPVSVPLRTLYRDVTFPPRLSPAATPDA